MEIVRLRVTPNTLNSLRCEMRLQPARYFLRPLMVQPHIIPGGAKNWTIPKLFQNQVPTQAVLFFFFCFIANALDTTFYRLFCGLMTTNAFYGTYNTNPYCFASHGCKEMTVLVNSFVRAKVEMSLATRNPTAQLRAYMSMLSAMRVLGTNEDRNIQLSEFTPNGPMTVCAVHKNANRTVRTRVISVLCGRPVAGRFDVQQERTRYNAGRPKFCYGDTTSRVSVDCVWCFQRHGYDQCVRRCECVQRDLRIRSSYYVVMRVHTCVWWCLTYRINVSFVHLTHQSTVPTS
jgi:hypothetical protein